MILAAAYLIALAVTAAYCARFGGRTGKAGAIIVAGGWLLSMIVVGGAMIDTRLETGLALLDGILLIFLVALSLVSNRHWPIWVAAFQLNTVAAHIAIALTTDVVPNAYYLMVTLWGIPILVVMAAGTWLDRRADKRRERLEGGAGYGGSYSRPYLKQPSSPSR